MSQLQARYRLDRPIDDNDHVLGPPNAPITLVEYGSYACPHCRAANERIAELRDRFGDRMRYVFRHRPLPNNELAERAAVLVEQADTPARFWDAHVRLMTRSETLTEEDLKVVARELQLDSGDPQQIERARARVEADKESAERSGVLMTEARRGVEVLRHGPSEPALRMLDEIHDRLESPASRMLRSIGPSSSYFVLPLFALANAGVVIDTEAFREHGPLMLAIGVALTGGKPLGFVLASAVAVKLRIAEKADAYSWRQLAGAGALAGIGFTMSLFIAGQAFPAGADFAAAKVAVFSASVLSTLMGVAVLWNARTAR